MCYAPALVGGGFGPSGGHLQCDAGRRNPRLLVMVMAVIRLEMFISLGSLIVNYLCIHY